MVSAITLPWLHSYISQPLTGWFETTLSWNTYAMNFKKAVRCLDGAATYIPLHICKSRGLKRGRSVAGSRLLHCKACHLAYVTITRRITWNTATFQVSGCSKVFCLVITTDCTIGEFEPGRGRKFSLLTCFGVPLTYPEVHHQKRDAVSSYPSSVKVKNERHSTFTP